MALPGNISLPNISSMYGKLKLERDGQIRVLDLQPGTTESEIRILLRVERLTNAYEALSYTWGASTENRVVRVNNDFVVSVTDNLFRALRCLRLPDTIRTLWIDALCINQSDDDEKSQQVQMMSRIYREASQVNVWLGECDSRDTSRASRLSFLSKKFFSFSGLRSLSNPGVFTEGSRELFAAMNQALAITQPQWYGGHAYAALRCTR